MESGTEIQIATVVGGTSSDRTAIAEALTHSSGPSQTVAYSVFRVDLSPPQGEALPDHLARIAGEIRRLHSDGKSVVFIDQFQSLLTSRGAGAEVLHAILEKPTMRVIAGVPENQWEAMQSAMRTDPVLAVRMELVRLQGRGTSSPSSRIVA